VGADIHQEHFTDADRARFAQRLDEQLRALDVVLKRPGFGSGPRTLGAELELCLVDDRGRPLAISEQIVRAANRPSITPEMGKFDIELSTPPVTLAGTPFTTLRESMQTTVRHIRMLAERHRGRVVPISILPTLRLEDFHPQAITNLPRYRALARGLFQARRGPFQIAIEGEEQLHIESEDAVAMEAANTAFQVHLLSEPSEFTDLFNAALLFSAPVLAAAVNSPTFLGRRLWQETRVALFKQAGDDRPPGLDGDILLPPRVNFGNGWVRDGAHELFMESVALHPPLLPDCCEDEAALALANAGRVPKLHELRMHHGTVWTWNRPVYDPANGGNLRIELRSLPAGPSYDDMLANASFLVGAMLGLKERIPQLVSGLPFALARRNFYLAAQFGLDAELAWPGDNGNAPTTVRADELLLSLLPYARKGLREAGVEERESERFLAVFEARVRSGQTGATWQRKVLARLTAQGLRGDEAMAALLERYITGFRSQRPVHAWPTEHDDFEVPNV
jgi:gamma-glutamyl:cysteine ligase YbdK (ATP-grasp superfamily)